jgi:hypothetical protein
MENQFWKTYSLVAGSVWDLSGFTDISVAPSAIYNFNEYVFGAGLQYKYLKQRDFLRLICMEEA